MNITKTEKITTVITKSILAFTLAFSMFPAFGQLSVANAEESASEQPLKEIQIKGRLKSVEEVEEELAVNGYVSDVIDRSNIAVNVPDTLKNNKALKNSLSAVTLPSEYDLRNIANRVTDVKSQGMTGTCWSFASNAAAEIAVSTATGSAAVDYSPFQTAYFGFTALSSTVSDLKGTETTQVGEGRYAAAGYEGQILQRGGGSFLAASLFLQGVGVAQKTSIDFPSSVLSSGVITAADGLSSTQRREKVARMTKWSNLGSLINTTGSGSSTDYASTNETVLQRIKEQIYSGKGVVISYYGETGDQYYDSSSSAQYTYEYRDTDHAVCVVGYKDDFPKEWFKSGHQPPQDGAFIVKNSWDDSWGDAGYFYLSYWDKSIAGAATFEFKQDSDSATEIVDQYDYVQPSGVANTPYKWYSNVFTATQKQELKSIGTYIAADNTSLEYKVYKIKSDGTNPNDVEGSLDSPAAQGSTTVDYEGYVTLDLDKAVRLKQGDKYAIWFSQKDTSGNYFCPIMFGIGSAYASSMKYYAKTTSNSNESFLSDYPSSGWSSWNAKSDEGACYDNLCVKGYSSSSPDFSVLTFQSNGGTEIEAVDVTNGTVPTAPTPPTKEGSTFKGWFSDEDLTQEYKFDTPLSEDKTIYAKWEKDKYNITYSGCDGATNNNPTEYYYDTSTITLLDPVKAGVTFIGWRVNDEDTPAKNLTIPQGSKGDKHFTAVWSDETYTITYYGCDGATNNNPATYTIGSDTITLTDPIKLGYEFTGWTVNEGDIPAKSLTIPQGSTGNKHFTANWQKIKYDITYTGCEGATNTNPTEYYIDSETITLTDPTKPGYVFTGWTVNEGDTPAKSLTIPQGSTGEKSFKANWSKAEFKITYSGCDGAANNNPTSYYIDSDTITLKDPEKTGYVFIGWTANDYDLPAKNLTIPKGSSGDKNFKANWNRTEYSITYSGCEGATNNNPTSYFIDSSTITLSDPVKTGYEFLGWTADVEETATAGLSSALVGDGVAPVKGLKINKGSTGNKSFTAHWKPIEYKITFANADGATNENTDKFTIETETFKLKDAAKEGWRFDGWYVDDAKVTQIEKGTHSDQTLTAKWTQMFTVTFKDWDNTVLKTEQVAYGDEATSPMLHPREGYDFVSWQPSNFYDIKFDTEVVATYREKEIYPCTVDFDSAGGDAVASETVDSRKTATKPADPKREGYTFMCWCSDPQFTQEFDFESPIEQNTTLYARWEMNQEATFTSDLPMTISLIEEEQPVAEENGDVNQNITPVKLTTTKASSVSTGDSLMFLMLGIAALALGCFFVLWLCRKQMDKNDETEQSSRNKNLKNKTTAVIIATLLVASASFGGLAGNSAFAESVETLMGGKSEAQCDVLGTVSNATLVFENKSDKDVTIEEITPPTELGSWSAVIGKATVPAGGSVSGSWDATSIPTDLLTRLKTEKSITLTYSAKLTYTNASTFTFDANSPAGTTATVDGTASVEKKLTNGTTLAAYQIPDEASLSCTSADGTNYVFAGWSEKQDDVVKNGLSRAQLAAKDINISEDETYYAVWMKEDGFWLGTKDQDATTYFNQAQFAKLDENYVTGDEILADMKVLEDSNNENYEAVKQKWDAYYSGDQVRLYATYEGGENEISYFDGNTTGETSVQNKYVEFRIIEVSGANGHLNSSSNAYSSDGSVVTFMATHVLPTAYQLNSTRTNEGGWAATELRAKLQDDGELYSRFSTNLTDNILRVPKLSSIGGGVDVNEPNVITRDAFWLMSFSELYNTSTYATFAPVGEGASYQWCKDKNIDGDLGNESLYLTTRANKKPGQLYDWLTSGHWERSSCANEVDCFLCVVGYGYPDGTIAPEWPYGIAPCFSFGKSLATVTFDSNAPEGTTAAVETGKAISERNISIGDTLTSEMIPADSDVTCTAEDGSTWFFAGWSENKNETVKDALFNSQLAAKNVTINEKRTYYAIWLKSDGFWLGTKDADKSFENELDFAKRDDNYVPAATILADMKVLEDSTNAAYAAVKQKWDAYYANADSSTAAVGNQVHLYATYEGGENEEAQDGSTSNMNKYVEFRILEVSGAEGHLYEINNAVNSDYSVVTFMATHLLPTAYQLNSTRTNVGGWAAAELREKLQDDGEIYSKFSKNLTDNILRVPKLSSTGGAAGADAPNTFSRDAFWLISYSELFNPSTYAIDPPVGEGAIYQWSKDKKIDGDRGNQWLVLYNRAGVNPGNTNTSTTSYWERSAGTALDGKFFCTEVGYGYPDRKGFADSYRGVAPCFSFGGPSAIVTFDTQEHGTKTTYTKTGRSISTNVQEYGASTGLTLEGWYDNPACHGDKVMGANETHTFTEDITLYANWVPTSGADDGNLSFWISPALETMPRGENTDIKSNMATDSKENRYNYVKEEWNVLKSSAEIKADVQVLIEGASNPSYADVVAEWKELMANDQYHLFTKYGTGTSANNYMESRIIEVNVDGGHKLTTGEPDGSSLITFASVYPITYSSMSSVNTNVGGWKNTDLRGKLQEGGSIFETFNKQFTNNIVCVLKEYNEGNHADKNTIAATPTEDKLWLLSYKEIVGEIPRRYLEGTTINEGTQYEWYSLREMYLRYNDCTLVYPRDMVAANNKLTNYFQETWVRSPHTGNNYAFWRYSCDYWGKFAFWGANDYGADKSAVVPGFSFGDTSPVVKFDANAPSGTTATVDGTNEKTSVKLAEGSALTSDLIPADSGLTCTSADGSTWVFAGWSENKDDTVENSKTNSELAALNVTVSGKKTYYAIWMKSNGFWLGTKGQSAETYFNEAQFLKHDANYVSGADVMADMTKLEGGSTEADYTTTKTKWDGYYSGDNVRLYATYSGGENEAANDGSKSVENKYVEFRILEVSGIDGHLNKKDDATSSDQSVVTFMATHFLPTAQQINSTATNVGGWGSSELRTKMQSSGEIYSKFQTSFTSNIYQVSKLSSTGGGAASDAACATTKDAFWTISGTELNGDGEFPLGVPTVEGAAYQWCKDTPIHGNKSNPSLKYQTRAGKIPGNSENGNEIWLRSAVAGSSSQFVACTSGGSPNLFWDANFKLGVAPCFSFGPAKKSIVTFDANAPEGTTATVDGTNKTTMSLVTNGSALTSDKIPADSGLTCKATDGSTWVFAGWSETKPDTVKNSLNNEELAAKNVTINANKTYYAIWYEEKGFWLGTKNQSAETFDKEVKFAKYDDNFVSATDVEVDWSVLSDAANTNYATVKTKWDGYYSGDNVRLYATYDGGESEQSYNNEGTSVENKYAEFRIIEVSGATGHLNVAGNASSSDASVVTFMTTHVLPTAYQMNTSNTNTGGWNSSALRPKLQSGGEIYNKFPTSLTNNILETSKLNNPGGAAAQGASGTTTTDAFWLPSYSELYATGTYWVSAPTGEGTAYKFFTDNSINGNASNPAITLTTRAGKTPGSSSEVNTIWWERSPRVEDGTGGTSKQEQFKAVHNKGSLSVSKNASECLGIPVCFSITTNKKVTFDANSPAGTTATIGGEASVTKTVKSTTLTSDIIPADDTVVATATDGATWLFAGWSENKDDTVANAKTNSELAAESISISGSKTYYAIWLKTSGFWLGTKNQSAEEFYDEVQFIKNDENYVSSDEILADMEKLEGDPTSTAYTSTKTKWDKYYSDDNVRLYAIYSGGENEMSYNGGTVTGEKSAENKYVEFRIIEVSGSAGHLNEAGNTSSTDGSVVTFMTTHVLPTAYQMNTTDVNAEGWKEAPLRTKLQAGGEIYDKFPTALTNNIMEAKKLGNTGNGVAQDSACEKTSDKFWLLSYGELYAKGSYYVSSPKGEGATYQWFKDKKIDGSSANANTSLAYVTRAGNTPGSSTFPISSWWQRSPFIGDSDSFMIVSVLGGLNIAGTSSCYYGVAPCFSFGVAPATTATVTYQANDPTGTTATVEGAENVTKNVEKGEVLTADDIPVDSSLSCTATDGNTWALAGGSEASDSSFENALKNSELAANAAAGNQMRLYLKWMGIDAGDVLNK